MAIIIIGIALGIFVCVREAWDIPLFGRIAITPFACISGVIVGALSGGIVASIFSLAFLAVDMKERVTESFPIYSVEDNIGVHGVFALGSGVVKSEHYIFYVHDTPYGKQIANVGQDNAYIQSTEKSQ